MQPIVAAYKSGDACGAGRVPARGVWRRLPGRAGPAFSPTPSAPRSARLTPSSRWSAPRQQWSLAPNDAQRITQPVLNVLGADSVQRFVEGSELVQSWFPHAERLSVPAAGHLLMVQNPTAVAQGLNNFVLRHPNDIVALADTIGASLDRATPDEEETMRMPISHPRRIAGSGVLSALLALSACGDHVGDRAAGSAAGVDGGDVAAIAGDARERGLSGLSPDSHTSVAASESEARRTIKVEVAETGSRFVPDEHFVDAAGVPTRATTS